MEQTAGKEPKRSNPAAPETPGVTPSGKPQAKGPTRRERFPPVKVARIHHPFSKGEPRKRLETLPHALCPAMARQPLLQPRGALDI